MSLFLFLMILISFAGCRGEKAKELEKEGKSQEVQSVQTNKPEQKQYSGEESLSFEVTKGDGQDAVQKADEEESEPIEKNIQKLCYCSNGELFVMNLDGSEKKQLASQVKVWKCLENANVIAYSNESNELHVIKDDQEVFVDKDLSDDYSWELLQDKQTLDCYVYYRVKDGNYLVALNEEKTVYKLPNDAAYADILIYGDRYYYAISDEHMHDQLSSEFENPTGQNSHLDASLNCVYSNNLDGSNLETVIQPGPCLQKIKDKVQEKEGMVEVDLLDIEDGKIFFCLSVETGDSCMAYIFSDHKYVCASDLTGENIRYISYVAMTGEVSADYIMCDHSVVLKDLEKSIDCDSVYFQEGEWLYYCNLNGPLNKVNLRTFEKEQVISDFKDLRPGSYLFGNIPTKIGDWIYYGTCDGEILTDRCGTMDLSIMEARAFNIHKFNEKTKEDRVEKTVTIPVDYDYQEQADAFAYESAFSTYQEQCPNIVLDHKGNLYQLEGDHKELITEKVQVPVVLISYKEA